LVASFSKTLIKPVPDLEDYASYQRVCLNTHCLGIGKLKGSQWVLSDATLCSYVQAEGALCQVGSISRLL